MAYLIPVIIVLMLGLMAYFLSKSAKKQSDWLNTLAQENNYKVVTQTKDFVYEIASTSSEQLWKMRAYSRSATTLDAYVHSSREYTEWTIEGKFNYGDSYIIPRDPTWKIMSDEKILSLLKPVWNKMGIPADDFTAYSLSDEEITNSFMIFCNDQINIKKLFTESFIASLRSWNTSSRIKTHISIRTTANRIQLQVNNVINDPIQAKKLIQLGLLITDSQ